MHCTADKTTPVLRPAACPLPLPWPSLQTAPPSPKIEKSFKTTPPSSHLSDAVSERCW